MLLPLLLLVAPGQVTIADFADGLTGWIPTGAVTVALENGHLIADWTGPAGVALPLEGRGNLVADAGGDALRLVWRGTGAINLVLLAVGDDLVARRYERRLTPGEEMIPLREFAGLRLRGWLTLAFESPGPARLELRWVEAVATGAGPTDLAASPFATTGGPAELTPLGAVAMHPGTEPTDAIRRALRLGFGRNPLSTPEQQRLSADGYASVHFVSRPHPATLIAGLGLTDADWDQDSAGRRTGEGIESAVFVPDVVARYARWQAEACRGRAAAPEVAAFALSSPVSRYGESHVAPSTAGGFPTFSRPARAAFAAWQRAKYGEAAVLEPMPDGPRPGPDGIDHRPVWSDFQHWYNQWFLDLTETCLREARRVTGKPFEITLGGPKVGPAQGVCLGNVGPLLRVLARQGPCLLNDTDSQTLFSLRYTSAACRQYGVRLMTEQVGPPHLHPYAQYNSLVNVLACGSPPMHVAHLGEINHADHWLGPLWRRLSPVLHRYRADAPPSDVAILHSYVTSWYRADRQNVDGVRLYDPTNTNWFADRGYPAWGRALGSPEVVDDQMIADGALVGRRLLVVPNSGVTITTRAALDAIRRFAAGGGTLVCFGTGCFQDTVEADGHLRATPLLDGLADAEPGDARYDRGRVVWYRRAAHPDLEPEFCRAMLADLPILARRAGARLWCRPDSPAINVVYAGRDRRSGRHLFVADLMRQALPEVTFARGRHAVRFDPNLRGEAELVAMTDSFVGCEGGRGSLDADGVLTVRFTLPGRLTLDLGTP